VERVKVKRVKVKRVKVERMKVVRVKVERSAAAWKAYPPPHFRLPLCVEFPTQIRR
jgi:hypothetical protein